ncbi:MAG: VOC family protein [Victivallaceae bacterium]|nr:VOC family protein [Victivallaceae bacterium]
MENNASSVIIKVKDIDICRSFYRNILNMGNPVVNSNFRVEFIMGNHASLVLLQDKESETAEPTTPPVIELNENIAEVCTRLDELECHYEFISNAEKATYKMCDPENRLIIFTGHYTTSTHHRPKHRRTASQRSAKAYQVSRRKPKAEVIPEL